MEMEIEVDVVAVEVGGMLALAELVEDMVVVAEVTRAAAAESGRAVGRVEEGRE